MFSQEVLLWGGFTAFIVGVLALDLGVFNRDSHVVSLREAAIWSAVWISLALGFNVLVLYFRGGEVALQFLTGYLIEKSLSVDNVFVFAMVFAYFGLPSQYQRRVLFWGIVGALVMRAVLILVGAALLKEYHWIIYVFGVVLVFTGIKMARATGHAVHPERNPVLRLVRRIMPVTDEYHGHRFVIRQAGRLVATPLLLVLVVIETTDLVFAVDSIPAIFAITDDPFIVYTSNVFAILGLRSLYFLLAGIMDRFVYLKQGIAVVLVFVGAKMLLTDIYKVPTLASLAVIAAVLGFAVFMSLRATATRGANQPIPVSELDEAA